MTFCRHAVGGRLPPIVSGSCNHARMNSDDTEKETLSVFLAAQRASVLAIVDGLDTQALNTSVLPSGWTPLGLVEHLGHAERHWFQEIVTGAAEPLPWPDDHAPLTTPREPRVVFAFYEDQCRHSDAVIARTPLSAPRRAVTPNRWETNSPTCAGSSCMSSKRPRVTPAIWTSPANYSTDEQDLDLAEHRPIPRAGAAPPLSEHAPVGER